MTDIAAIENAIQKNTRLIIVETPSNPMLKITDISYGMQNRKIKEYTCGL